MNSNVEVSIGRVKLGAGNPVVIQSMTNTDTHDYKSTLKQIGEMYESGAELVRVAYPDRECMEPFRKITSSAPCPIIADIHFDAKLAVDAIKAGASKIRINPGNLSKKNILEIISAAKDSGVPIRIGVNSGSLEKDILEKYGSPTEEALAESAIRSIGFFEENGFKNLVVSIKSSDVMHMIKSNMLLKGKCSYPIHIGVTEAGGLLRGSIKNSIGISVLLLNGVGDTIRVSLSDDPSKEVEAAKMILKSMHMYSKAPDIISCPTCSRTTFDVIGTSNELEQVLKRSKKNIKVAVMGCVVNGPGESAEADFGITGSGNDCVVFKKGEIIFKGAKEPAFNRLLKEMEEYEDKD